MLGFMNPNPQTVFGRKNQKNRGGRFCTFGFIMFKMFIIL